jgi:hypothetical protein
MSIKQKVVEFWSSAKKSATMWVAAFWVIIGVVEMQISLLQPLIGEKYFGVLSIVVSATLALARMRTLVKK